MAVEPSGTVNNRVLAWLRQNKELLIYFVAATVITSISCIHYWLTALSVTTIGFNLDDSWIHLEFARSIFEGRAWEYSPGYPSTGSTSPLWSILLAGLFFFTTDPISLVWGVMIVSALFYILCTFIVGLFFSQLIENKLVVVLGMVGFVLIPSNTWLMLSGMEYPLLLFLTILPIIILEKTELQYDVLLGIIAGLAFLSRPEAVLLALIVFPIRLIQHISRRDFTKERAASIYFMFLSAFLVVIPWILQCIQTSGNPLPDTFYVKVGEVTPYHIDVWDIFWGSFFSTMPFLLMGIIVGVALFFRKRPYPWLFAISLALLYRFTMPYQAMVNNSRYVTPIFSFLLISCVAGFLIFGDELKQNVREFTPDLAHGTLSALLLILVIVPSTLPYMAQANVYATATKNINEMQVDIGMWIQDNTPADAVLAIGDIGAIRFLSNRVIIDLVGLVTPEIAYGDFSISELRNFLRSRDCDYLVIFGKWISHFGAVMGDRIEEVYSVAIPDNIICGDDSMHVFEITW